MSYQAEERYWTDYLRIALPIAGMLLLLGVFWYWASSFIGDDNDNPPQTPVAAVATTPITAVTPTPTVSTAVTIAVQTMEPTEESEAPAATEEPDAEPTPTTDPGQSAPSGTFAEGDQVIVNDNDVNMRDDASIDGEIVDTLEDGTELTILSGESVVGGEYVWWNVEGNLSGLQGWVAEGLFDAA